MTGVRWRPDTGFEGKCGECAEFWPLDMEFWYPKQGLRRCRACYNVWQSRANRRVREIAAIRLHDRRRYKREWMQRRRLSLRRAEGRRRYERRSAA